MTSYGHCLRYLYVNTNMECQLATKRTFFRFSLGGGGPRITIFERFLESPYSLYHKRNPQTRYLYVCQTGANIHRHSPKMFSSNSLKKLECFPYLYYLCTSRKAKVRSLSKHEFFLGGGLKLQLFTGF